MPTVVIIEGNLDRGRAYSEVLERADCAVRILGSDTDVIDYLVRKRKAPDVVLLDMRRPGSAEMLVISAVSRLSHLSDTKILAIGHCGTRGGQPSAQSGGIAVDMELSTPVSPDTLRNAIYQLTATSGRGVRAKGTAEPATRVWWEGAEAVFVRWTDQALIFAWQDATETAVKIPRGAVIRLLRKGVLDVEGYVPVWLRLSPAAEAISESMRAAATSTPVPSSSFLEADPAYEAEFRAQHAPVAAPEAVTDQPQRSEGRLDKVSVIARLIRKLTRGDDSRQNRLSEAVTGLN